MLACPPEMPDRHPRGSAYHEAGHAIVAWSLGLRIGTILIRHDDASGETEIGDTKDLSLIEQIAVCAAGYTAEAVFGYPTHYWIAAEDYNKIRKLLEDNAIPEEERGVALRKKGAERARVCLEVHRNKVVELA